MQEMQLGTVTLEEEMATHTSILAWRIPWTEEPGGLQSMGWQSQTQLSTLHNYKKEKQTLQTVGPPIAGQSTLLDCFPVHLNEDNRGPRRLDNIPTSHGSIPPSRKSHGQRSLAVYSPWDHKESDTTEWLTTTTTRRHAMRLEQSMEGKQECHIPRTFKTQNQSTNVGTFFYHKFSIT